MAQEQAAQNPRGSTRRDFLIKASLGLAAAFTVGGPIRAALQGRSSMPLPRFPGQGSIFQPRADQRWKVWKRWHKLFGS